MLGLYLGIYILFIIFIYLLGAIINVIFNKNDNKYYDFIFSSLIYGLISVVTIFSIIITGCKTVFIIVPIIIILYFLLFKKLDFKKLNFNLYIYIVKVFEIKKLLIILLVSIGPFLFQYYSLLDSYNSSFPIRIVSSDYIFYSKISEYLLLTGQENAWQVHNTILKEFTGSIPYHYFNEWIVAFLINFSSGKSIYLQEIVVFTLTSVICVFGFLSILEHFKNKINFGDLVLCTFCIFFKFIVTIKVLTGIEFFSSNSFVMHKVSVLYIFIIYSILQFLKKQFSKGFLFLSMMLVFYIVPAVIAGVIVVNIFLFKISKLERVKNIFISMVVIILFGVFYLITRNHLGDNSSSLHFDTPKYFKTFINILGGTFLQILALCIPFLILLLFNIYFFKIKFKEFLEDNINIILISIFIVIAAAFAWASLNFLTDSVQLFQNISIVVMNILFITLFFYFFKYHKFYPYLSLIFILVFNIYQTGIQRYENQFYSTKYIESIESIINSNNLNSTGVCLFGKENYETKNHDYYINHPFSVNTNTSILGSQLKYLKNNFNLVCISTFEIPTLSDPFIENMVTNSCFNTYCKKYNYKNINEAKINFINKYKIDYVIASKFANIDFLKDKVKTIIIDSETKEKFILLK